MTSAESAQDVLSDFVSQLNDESNDIAERLDNLAAQLGDSEGNVSADDLNTALQPISDRLKSLGGSTDNPVPTPTDPGTTTDPTNSPGPDDPSVQPPADDEGDNPPANDSGTSSDTGGVPNA